MYQVSSSLRVRSHLLKKYMEDVIFCTVNDLIQNFCQLRYLTEQQLFFKVDPVA